MEVVVGPVQSVSDVDEIRELFVEYAESLGFSLCFQSFDKELAEFPGDYSPPSGSLALARADGKIAGCVALHGLDPGTCEMKRLYVKPGYRGLGIGRRLAKWIIADAAQKGYYRMRLDTLETMREARVMYESLGFRRIDPYRFNPLEDAVYMELDLRSAVENDDTAGSH